MPSHLVIVPDYIDGVQTGIVFLFVALAFIAVQFFTCWKWEWILIRLIPVSACVIAAIAFFLVARYAPEGIEDVQKALEVQEAWTLVWLGSLVALGSDGLGWVVWTIWSSVTGNSPSNPAGY